MGAGDGDGLTPVQHPQLFTPQAPRWKSPPIAVHDALDVLEHAKATPAAHRRLRQMRSDCLGGCLKSAQQLLKAHALFVEMTDDDGDNEGRLPAASLCSSLVESLAMRGHAALAEKVLATMADDEMALTAKLCCQVVMALLRAGLASKAFGVFESIRGQDALRFKQVLCR